MKLTDMKLSRKTKEELKKEANEWCSVTDDRNRYPYGLEVDLDSNSMKALGKSVDEFEVGSTIGLVAATTVKSLRKNERQDGTVNQHMELQIEKMHLVTGKKSEKPKPKLFQSFKQIENSIGGVISE